MSLPDDVFRCAPIPADLVGQPFSKRPNFNILASAINAVQFGGVLLLNEEPKASFEPERGFVAHECQVPSGGWNLDHARGKGSFALLGRSQKGFSAEEGVCKGADVIILAILLPSPLTFGRFEILGFS